MSARRFFEFGSQPAQRRVAVRVVAIIAIAGAALWWAITAATSIPDFTAYAAGPDRKAAFFTFMRPVIQAETDRISDDREKLLAIAGDGAPGWLDRLWLGGLANDYGLNDLSADDPELIERLLRRVDIVPMSLALAQAAKESGWGTSRFARKGNNLFGEWCFEAGCGLVPKSRVRGATHEVETFFSPRRSVRSYLDNINTHEKYRAFRRERARMRADGTPLSGIALANKLSQYSERREAYVREIKALIATNNLEAQPETNSD